MWNRVVLAPYRQSHHVRQRLLRFLPPCREFTGQIAQGRISESALSWWLDATARNLELDILAEEIKEDREHSQNQNGPD